MKKQTKQELRKQLNELLKKEERELAMVHYPEFKKLEGRYFKHRNNFSCPKEPSDYWFVYTKVIEIKPEDLYMNATGPTCHYNGWSFQTDKYKEVSIKLNEHSYMHLLGTEITEAEFFAAWNKLADNLNNLK